MPSLLDSDVPVELDIYTDSPGAFPTSRHTRITGVADKQSVVRKCHQQSVASGDPVVIACPDMIFGAGTLKAIVRQMNKGKRLIAVPSLRLDRVQVGPLFKPGMSNREVTELALKTLHPNTKSMFWGDDFTTGTPYQIYWRTQSSIVARCFHMHPLLIWAERGSAFRGTVDDDCVNLFQEQQAHVVGDSDEIACFETSPTGYVWENPESTGKDIRSWVNRKTNNMHRWFFKHECHIHTGNMKSVALPQELIRYG